MARIGRDELIKLARISQILVSEHELDKAVATLDARLEYTTILQEILAQHSTELPPEQLKPNRFREDVVIRTDPEPILAEAPQSEAHYFVVPVIIKQNV
jgi:aspartyl/glutamyl-tRNA(Asn/Gln) amidotransferase C subunit